MYSKEEASQLRQAFWTAFGQYLAPIPNAEGIKINWVNYKTGIKNLHLKMKAVGNINTIGIEITHSDPAVQQLFYDQFLQLKKGLTNHLGNDWTWKLHDQDDEGKTTSKIYKELTGPRIFNKADWPQLISFFKQHLLAFDAFWSEYQFAFDALK